MAKKTQSFQAEVKEILDLMIHSLYSQKEIFLRELISNSSDAMDKLKFLAITNKEINVDKDLLHIRLEPNKELNQLKIIDNGVGMNHDEVIENIGTIAHSGTKAFLQKSQEIKERPELIGQFGVGFYSAFMVADELVLHTQKAGENNGVLWQSTGDGTYTIDEVPRAEGVGTTITLKLKKFEANEEVPDFTDEYALKGLVKKYSDFIAYPIKMTTKKQEPKKDSEGKDVEGEFEEVTSDEVLNSQKALWLRPASEVKEEEYKEFYRHISHDWNDPLKTIHFKAEGIQEYSAVLYIPSKKPWNFNYRDTEWGLDLYVKRVFIMNHCEELIPNYFRFIKGVVDSSDLSLNVSREILQQDSQVQGIRKGVIGKIFKALQEMLEKDRESYDKFWDEFGPTLKEGVPTDHANKEKLEKLLLFHSSYSDKMITLEEYVKRMKNKQKAIYYISGDSIDRLRNSPYMEKLKEKDYEVLFLTDPVDEWVIGAIPKFKDFPIQSIMAEDLNLDSEEEKKAKEEEKKKHEEKYKSVKETLQSALDNYIREIKFSDRLVDTPACLVSGAGDPSAHMEKIMKSMGQEVPKGKRILEINPKHPVFEKMSQMDVDTQKLWAEILYGQALLNEGSQLQDPVKFSKQVAQLMVGVEAANEVSRPN